MRIWQINSYGSHVHKYELRVYTFVTIIFGVSPTAYGHQAKAAWTADGWNTVCWSNAAWQRNPDGCYEEWNVSLIIPSHTVHPGADPTYRFWYALCVEDAGGFVYWDNNNGWNYEYIVPGRYPDIISASCA